MSNRIFQSVIVQLKDATDRVLGVIDSEGIVVSCSDSSMLGEKWTDAALKVGSSFDAMLSFDGKTFKAIVGNSNYFEYAVFSGGEDAMARSMCTMAYESVIGRGRLETVPEAEREAAQQCLMAHYGRPDFAFDRASMAHTRVFRLAVKSMTGKRRKRK